MVEATTVFDFDRSKLALSYDAERLQQDTLAAIHDMPPYIFYTVVPLTIAGGRNKEVSDFSNPEWASWTQTQRLKESPYFLEVLESLECEKTSVRLMRLGPGWSVDEHTDPQLDLEFRNQIRLHVPIFVNDSVDFILNGTKVPLQPGDLWYMRLSDPHSVHNNGQTERIQLSIDVVVNAWVEEMIINGEKP